MGSRHGVETAMQAQGGAALFIGRTPELRQLQDAYASAVEGRGSVLLLSGEPGIGKTTLCRELAAWVTGQGALALLGQCDDAGELSVPYLPFVEALRTGALPRVLADVGPRFGPEASELVRIVPELGGWLPEVPAAAPSTDPADARYRLRRAVTTFLTMVAAAVPILLVLEDLQDADHGTLDLLTAVSRHVGGARVLVVGTYRSTEVDRDHPLTQAIARMRRRATVERLRLAGLTPDEVQHLVDGIAGRVLPSNLGNVVYAQTEGNPLFVWEVMRQRLQAGGFAWGTPLGRYVRASADDDVVPDGLIEVIGTRLARLSPDCRRLLTIAAVIGREFGLGVVRAVADRDEEQVTAALDEAVRAAVLRERIQVGGVQYRFAHALFRQALAADLSAAERLRLHPRVARALEARYGSDDDEHTAELAEHFGRSADPDDLRKALEYSQRAAAYATSVYASTEAARLFGHALAIQEALAPDDRALRCDLLIGQGQALLDGGEARRVLDEIAPRAFALAERLADADRASAVCQLAMDSFTSDGSSHALSSPEAAPWGERADRWAQPGTVARVWADLFLGGQSYFRERWFDGMPRLTRALDLARTLDNSEALWWAAYFWIGYAQSPQHAGEQLRLSEEFVSQSRIGASTRTLALTLSWIGATFLCQGQRARAEAVWEELTELAARTGQPAAHLHALRGPATFATLDGRLDEAAVLADRIVKDGLELGLPEHAQIIAGLSGLRAVLHLGRHDEVARMLARGTVPQHVLGMAYLGQTREVWAHLDEFVLARPGFGTDQDETHGYMDTFRLEAAVLVGHRAAAERLLDRLRPLDHVTTGVRVPTCVARHLGAAAVLLGRHDEALAYYQSALELARAMRFRPEIALTRLELAELFVTSLPGRQDEVAAHLALALPELRAMGMAPALARAERLAARVGGRLGERVNGRPTDGLLSPREVEVLRLVAAGKSNAEIAEALVVSIRTAERHLANIYAKLGTGGPAARAAATSYAHTHGVVRTGAD